MSKTTIYIPVPCDGKELPERDIFETSVSAYYDAVINGRKLPECYYYFSRQSWYCMSIEGKVTPSHWYKAVEVSSQGLDALVKKSMEDEKIKRMAADECKRGNRMWE